MLPPAMAYGRWVNGTLYAELAVQCDTDALIDLDKRRACMVFRYLIAPGEAAREAQSAHLPPGASASATFPPPDRQIAR